MKKLLIVFVVVTIIFLFVNISFATNETTVKDSVISKKSFDKSNYWDVKKSANKKNLFKSKVEVKNIKVSYSKKVKIKATVKNIDNKRPVNSGKVLFKLNSKNLGYSTVKKGHAYYNLDTKNLRAKKYKVKVFYQGSKNISSSKSKATLNIKKMKVKVSIENHKSKTNSSTFLRAKVCDFEGRKINYGKVSFRINNLFVSNAKVINGIAKVKYLPRNIVKNYTIVAKYIDNSRYASGMNKSKLIVSLKVSILKWGSGGDIKHNRVLYSNISKYSVASSLVNASKFGTPCVCLGDGKGKSVFIVAGVHGNELSSQSAAVRLIDRLSTKNIHGYIYIIPFLAPSSTGNKTRYYKGVNLNSVTHIKGTITNKLFNFAKSKNVISLGDFHTSQPGAVPGRNSVFGTYVPLYSSASLARYITNQTHTSLILYHKAGVEYPGAVEDYCNLNRITSVTCEVRTPHGKIYSGSVEKSYSMMLSYLRYYKLIN